MNCPDNLKYTRDHEWIRVESNNEGVIGITAFAQKELGDVAFVDIDTEGETLSASEKFGTVEAVKAVSDLFMPVSGEVLSVNAALESAPEMVNTDPYGGGWMIRIRIIQPAEVDALMNAAEYEAFLPK